MGGRPPKPKKLKILEGNRGRRSLDYYEPEGHGQPKMPATLDPVAQECWRASIGQIVANGAGESDSIRIAGMCRWYSLFMHWWERVSKGEAEGMVHLEKAWRGFDGAASKFGLSPTDRARLRTEPQKKKQSKWGDLIA